MRGKEGEEESSDGTPESKAKLALSDSVRLSIESLVNLVWLPPVQPTRCRGSSLQCSFAHSSCFASFLSLFPVHMNLLSIGIFTAVSLFVRVASPATVD